MKQVEWLQKPGGLSTVVADSFFLEKIDHFWGGCAEGGGSSRNTGGYEMGGFMELDKVGGGRVRLARELFSMELPQNVQEI